MLEAALRYPTNGEKASERVPIGGVLVVLSVFVLPAFLVYGYLVRSPAAVVFAAVLFTFGLALFVVVPLGAFIDFWVYLVTVYLFGAAYREAIGGGAERRPASA